MRAAFVAALALSTIACGKSGAPSSAQPHLATAHDLCVAYGSGLANIDAQQKALDRCDGKTPPAFLEGTAAGQALLAAMRTQCQAGDKTFDTFDQAIKGGHVTFDADRLQACLAKGKAARHGAPLEVLSGTALTALAQDPDCQHFFTPLQQEGGACTQDWDCPPGTFCDAVDPTKQQLTCVKPANPGDNCGARRCDPNTSFCSQDTCHAWRALGEKCKDITSADPCGPGNRCDQAHDVCAKLPVAGETCTDTCADGLVCDGTMHCAPKHHAADGAACTRSEECAGACSICRPQAVGSTTLVCQPRGHEGDPCQQDEQDDCARGFHCHQQSSGWACTADLPAQVTCSDTDLCADGLFCDPGSKQCTPQHADGAACDPTIPRQCGPQADCISNRCSDGRQGDTCTASSCQKGLACVQGLCGPPPAAGQPCAGYVCAEGAFCENGTCAAQRAAGEACASDSACRSGTCLQQHLCAAERTSGGCADTRDFVSSVLPFGLLLVLGAGRRRGSRR